jgi:hypothetical protein
MHGGRLNMRGKQGRLKGPKSIRRIGPRLKKRPASAGFSKTPNINKDNPIINNWRIDTPTLIHFVVGEPNLQKGFQVKRLISESDRCERRTSQNTVTEFD